MKNYDIPIIATITEVIENRLNNNKNKIIYIPEDELLKECIIYFFDELIKENNESRIKLLEKELNYFYNHSLSQQSILDFSFKETRTIEEVPFDKPAEYNFHKGSKKEKEEVDNFSQMFGYEDEVALKNKKQEEQKKTTKKVSSVKIKQQEIKKEPEIIQTELLKQDIDYCELLKEKFVFVKYELERIYHSCYLIAHFKTKDNIELVLIKFKNSYLLTNKCYLYTLKGENNYENLFSCNRNE